MNKEKTKSKPFIHSDFELKKLGENIGLARERRKMTTTELAIKASVSRMSLMRIEKGDPAVGIGKVFNVLSALGLLKGLADMADPALDRSQAIHEIANLRESVAKKEKNMKGFYIKKAAVKKNLDF